MSKTFDTQIIIDNHLDLGDIALPEGMGVGALRHKVAAATRDNWESIKAHGIRVTVANHRDEFLGDASDPEDLMDENYDTELPADAQDLLRDYLQQWNATDYGRLRGAAHMAPPTPDYIDALMADLLADSLSSWVEQHIRLAILEKSGADVECDVAGVHTLDGWGVK